MDSKLAVPAVDEQWDSDVSEGYEGPPPSYRRDSESSTERSLYDDKDQALFTGQSTSNQGHEYGVYHPKFASRGFVITDSHASTQTSKVPLYYVEMSQFAIKKPDVIFHQLPPSNGMTDDFEHLAQLGEHAPVIAVAHLPKFSQQIKAGLGDPSSSAGMTYLEVNNPNKLTHGEYRMSLNGKSYAWKRTHKAEDGLEGSSIVRTLNRTSFQLFDLSTNEVIAVFLHNMYKSWKKVGKIRIFKDLDHGGYEMQQLKLLLFLSISAILEKARRRRNRRRNHASGGGP
ncbi:hypothetical protein H2200_003393 [Cladophialophora chaetospira]|uniref:Uncharacterized protein n=1 Tax=Cladophialophora chaetospira TaxID=386627 RepID=A0AA38XHH0_9EURO|nr:hypothetical protein H2200_003393 [Cladophialophora chaetospira]